MKGLCEPKQRLVIKIANDQKVERNLLNYNCNDRLSCINLFFVKFDFELAGKIWS